jgi:hypothetical protein
MRSDLSTSHIQATMATDETPLLALLVTREGTMHVLAAIVEGISQAAADTRAMYLQCPVNRALMEASKMAPWKLENQKINSCVNAFGIMPAPDPTDPVPEGSIVLNLSDSNGDTERWRTTTTAEFLEMVIIPVVNQSIVVQRKMLEEMDSLGAVSAQLYDTATALHQTLRLGDHLACLYAVLFAIACHLIPVEELGPPALYAAAITQWETETDNLRDNLHVAVSGSGDPTTTASTAVGVAMKWLGNITHGHWQWLVESGQR